MSIDTRNKRSSAIDPRMPWRRDYPLADGTIDAGDRAQTADDYRGLYDTGTTPVTPTVKADYIVTYARRRRKGGG